MAHFPDLQTGSMSSDQFEMFMEGLYEETKRLKLNFASLMLDLQKDLEKRLSVDELVNVLVFCDKNFEGVLTECTSFSQVFRKVLHFVSFFDYDLLEHLIDKYGSDATEEKLETYIGYFREFSKRRAIECPSNTFSDHDSGSSEKILVFVADKIIEDLTLDELKKFNRRINKTLGNKLVKVVHGGGQMTLPGNTYISVYS